MLYQSGTFSAVGDSTNKHGKGTVSLQSPHNTRFDKMCPTKLLIILECDVYIVLVGCLFPQDETVNA